MRPCKIKLDDYDLRVIVNGMMKYRDSVPSEELGFMGPMLLRLIDTTKAMNPENALNASSAKKKSVSSATI